MRQKENRAGRPAPIFGARADQFRGLNHLLPHGSRILKKPKPAKSSARSSKQVAIRLPTFFSAAYSSRGTLPQKKKRSKGATGGPSLHGSSPPRWALAIRNFGIGEMDGFHFGLLLTPPKEGQIHVRTYREGRSRDAGILLGSAEGTHCGS